MRRKLRRICAVMCAALLAALLPVLPSAAQLEPAAGSLTVQYAQEGARFDIYRAAEMQADGRWELTGVFAGYPVTLPGNDWLDTAATLAAIVADNDLPADASGVIAGGTAFFPNLAQGMYLVVGQPTEAGGYRYTPVPFMVWVSGPVTAVVKFQQEELPAQTTAYTVQKVWSGDSADVRPDSVTVRLLCDGAEYATAVLNSENGWSYTWENLEANHRWQVVELHVPQGYTVSSAQSGQVFTLINTYTTPVVPEEPTTLPPEDNGETPDTGDRTNYALAAGILLASASAASVLALCRKKTRASR